MFYQGKLLLQLLVRLHLVYFSVTTALFATRVPSSKACAATTVLLQAGVFVRKAATTTKALSERLGVLLTRCF